MFLLNLIVMKTKINNSKIFIVNIITSSLIILQDVVIYIWKMVLTNSNNTSNYSWIFDKTELVLILVEIDILIYPNPQFEVISPPQ